MAICVECEWYADAVTRDGMGALPACKNPDLPMTDYVYGHRHCRQLNPQGNCKGFKPQSESSIYELKEDEELAKT